MNRVLWSVGGAFVVSAVLSACGGGGGGGGTGGSGGPGGEEPLELVDGDFNFADPDTNPKYYQNPDADKRQDVCQNSDYYFESDNFVVYSNLTTHSNDDLILAASKAQDAMDNVLPLFGMTWADFKAMKRIVSFSDISVFALEASKLGLSTADLAAYFPGIQDGTEAEQQAFIYNALVNEESPAAVRSVMEDFIADNPSMSDITPIHEQIQICATSSDRIARSSTSGIKIAPSFSNAVYRHEAIHLVINQISKFPAFWAKEGQTHLFRGDVIRAPAEEVDVSNMIIGTDEAEPGDEVINEFMIAFSELSTELGASSLDKVMQWYRQSMNIQADFLDGDGAIPGLNDNGYDEFKLKKENQIKAEFDDVMAPLTYEAFFNGL